MLYVYALLGVRPDQRPSEAGCQVIGAGNLFAAVAEIERPLAVDEQSLRLHDQTVRELAASVEAILPVRFNSVFANEASLAQALAAREPELLLALELVTNREQMTVRVHAEPETSSTAVEAELPATGTSYLLAKKRLQDRDILARSIEAIHLRVEGLIRAERIERHKPVLASVFHLIDRGRSGEYAAALADSAANEVRFTFSGPWPPYAFGPRELI